MIRKTTAILSAITLMLILLSSCATYLGDPPAPAEEAGISPLMWRVTAPNGQNMYLFGSIHIADDTIYPLPDYVMDAFWRADYLAVEVDIDLLFDPVFMSDLMIMQMYQDGRTIVDDIGPELHAAATAVFADHGFPPGTFDIFKPYAWWQTLQSLAMLETGLTVEYGVDYYFIRMARAAGMEVLALETPESQLNALMGMSMPIHIVNIEQSLDMQAVTESLLYVYDLWQIGDYDALEFYLRNNYYSMPDGLWDEFIRALLIDRDILITPQLREMMAAEMNVFVVVGLAHFVGENSIVYLLRQEGYEVVIVR